jgi:hypothetical protein
MAKFYFYVQEESMILKKKIGHMKPSHYGARIPSIKVAKLRKSL